MMCRGSKGVVLGGVLACVGSTRSHVDMKSAGAVHAVDTMASMSLQHEDVRRIAEAVDGQATPGASDPYANSLKAVLDKIKGELKPRVKDAQQEAQRHIDDAFTAAQESERSAVAAKGAADKQDKDWFACVSEELRKKDFHETWQGKLEEAQNDEKEANAVKEGSRKFTWKSGNKYQTSMQCDNGVAGECMQKMSSMMASKKKMIQDAKDHMAAKMKYFQDMETQHKNRQAETAAAEREVAAAGENHESHRSKCEAAKQRRDRAICEYGDTVQAKGVEETEFQTLIASVDAKVTLMETSSLQIGPLDDAAHQPQAIKGDIVVEDAGYSACNGQYVYAGKRNGKDSWEKPTGIIFWSSHWGWGIGSGGHHRYMSKTCSSSDPTTCTYEVRKDEQFPDRDGALPIPSLSIKADITGVWQDPARSFYGGAIIRISADSWHPEVSADSVWSTSSFELQHTGENWDMVEVKAAGQTYHHEALLGSDGLLWIRSGQRQWKLAKLPEASCTCTTPNAGTVGKNGYTCDDGSSAWCAANQECYSTASFAKGNWGEGCRLPQGREMSEPDRKQEWKTLSHMECMLERGIAKGLKGGPVNANDHEACADQPDLTPLARRAGEFGQLTRSHPNAARAISFGNGEAWTVSSNGETAADYTKGEFKPTLNPNAGEQPFDMCPDENDSWKNIISEKMIGASEVGGAFWGKLLNWKLLGK